MSIKDNRQRLMGVFAVLTVAVGFLALQHYRQDNSDADQVTSSAASHAETLALTNATADGANQTVNPLPVPAPTKATDNAGPEGDAEPLRWEPMTLDPQFHVYIPQEHEHHEYADELRFNTDTLKVYASNGDALAAFFVGTRLFWTEPEEGAQYLKLATVLSGKAGPLDVLAKKYSRGRVEDFEEAYLLGYAAAAIGYYEGYEEIVPKTERMLWKRYDIRAANDPDFSAEEAMARLRARRAQIVRELNQSPLIQIDDSVDYPHIKTLMQPNVRDGE